jgi:predicted PurR-regulated permease PerM
MSAKTDTKSMENKAYRWCIYILTSLALLYTAHLAQDILLLLLFAGLTSLLLSPGMRMLERLFIPRVLGASILLSAIVLSAFIFASQLQEPIARWAKVLPKLSTQVTEQIQALNNAIETTATINQPEPPVEEEEGGWFSWFKSSPEPPVVESKNDADMIQIKIKESLFSLVSDFLASTPFTIIQFLTTIILILFTLVYSPALFKHYVSLFIKEDKQKNVHRLALKAQKQLSRYIVTVSFVNFGLGLSAFLFLHIVGFKDALLLGTLIGLLNFIPYVGPLIALGLIFIGGYVQWGIDINLLVCMGGVLAFNIVESQFVTPMTLAQQMKINPFVIVLWLLFCGWMWGLMGVLIAVPLIVCIKLMFSQFDVTKKWAQLVAT